MLSKMKSAHNIAETRSAHRHNITPSSATSNTITDDEDGLNNDSNNNNQNTIFDGQQGKNKSQDELLEIVDASRKRRLSKDSADSLTDFVKWSFNQIEPTARRFSSDYHKGSRAGCNDIKSEEADLFDEEEVDWAAVLAQKQGFPMGNRFKVPEQLLLRQHSKGAGGGSSAANLALLKEGKLGMSPSSLLTDSPGRGANGGGSVKRARTQAYSPTEAKMFSQSAAHLSGISNNGAPRKSSSYLGSVVERLHQQQQHQQQAAEQLESPHHNQPAQELDQDGGSSGNSGLSYHLQQFLQQQTSLEDLCSSVGLDDSNQLVLAAAIHRALVDSVGPPGGGQLSGPSADSKSTASSTGSSCGGGSSGSNNNSNLNNLNQVSALNSSGANLHLVDSLNRQRRAYNTRAALHGITSSANQRQNAVATAASAAMNMSNRNQQQRHAQAAAALSALASAGSHQLSSSGTPMVDFECDTCGSSFDDRHRLMQHQSIHLELKKDWFTETPVDEVMKIFNRRRGEFLCNTCNLRFEATFDYDKHNHSVHGQRPYCCQFCGNGTRTFRFWRQYLNHLYDHRYIFSCTIDDCDFTVNRRDSLRFHIFRFHLNCQLPQNQHQQLRSQQGHNMLIGGSKWPTIDDDEDLDNDDTNVGE